MAERVADVLWSMLAGAGVKRCYGIVGDALNPVVNGLRRNGQVEFIHVRNEEAGVFAAVADACLTDTPVVVCGTAGPGVIHLLNGLIDAQREGAPVIALAGDTLSGVIDTGTVEEINPYATFQVASLYTGRIVNPAQTRTVVQTAIGVALSERGPTVIAIPGDVAASTVPEDSYQAVLHNPPLLRPSDSDLQTLAGLLDAADSVTIFGGDGCREGAAVEREGLGGEPGGSGWRSTRRMTRAIGESRNRSSTSLISTRPPTWTSPSIWSPWAWVITTSETSSSSRPAAAIAAGSSGSRVTSMRANGTFRATAVSPASTSRRNPSCSIAQQWIGSGSAQAPGRNRSSCRRGPGRGKRKLCLTRTAPVVRAWIFMPRAPILGDARRRG